MRLLLLPEGLSRGRFYSLAGVVGGDCRTKSTSPREIVEIEVGDGPVGKMRVVPMHHE
jgi:hypothetical protein